MLAKLSLRFLLSVLLGLLLAAATAAQEPAQPPPDKDEPAAQEPAEEEPATVVIPVGTHIPLVLQNSVNTKTAEPGDFVYFETIYPVVVNNRILIPVGSFVRGTVTQVKRPGRIKGRGELHVRFDDLTLPNGYTTRLSASLASAGTVNDEEVDRTEGSVKSDTTKGEDVGTVAGTTAAGAGIGAIAGRGKGTAIGAGAGAAAGLAWILLTRGREVVLARGTTLDIVLDRPLELDAALARFDWTGQPTSLPGAPPASNQTRRPIGSRIPF
ncbi:MAG: hypothetical protein HYY26_06180 [Acidobacteria bacterium]|nr:hypothetical protein [Acidobacteriota bacterium]